MSDSLPDLSVCANCEQIIVGAPKRTYRLAFCDDVCVAEYEDACDEALPDDYQGSL